mmetsp:Transcript_73679/g.209948  ORF Transcript_73679/g.209948 Transcript_73679/m.209948 type:complete len:249 (+) Transcript_73679:1875-2621(+)
MLDGSTASPPSFIENFLRIFFTRSDILWSNGVPSAFTISSSFGMVCEKTNSFQSTIPSPFRSMSAIRSWQSCSVASLMPISCITFPISAASTSPLPSESHAMKACFASSRSLIAFLSSFACLPPLFKTGRPREMKLSRFMSLPSGSGKQFFMIPLPFVWPRWSQKCVIFSHSSVLSASSPSKSHAMKHSLRSCRSVSVSSLALGCSNTSSIASISRWKAVGATFCMVSADLPTTPVYFFGEPRALLLL